MAKLGKEDFNKKYSEKIVENDEADVVRALINPNKLK